MIEINLLPDKPKEPKAKSPAELLLPSIPVLPIFAAFLALLMLAYFIVGSAVISKKVALARYGNTWDKMSEARKAVEPVRDKLSRIHARNKLIDSLAGNRILWSEKLDRISADLADGIWLRHLMIGGMKPAGGRRTLKLTGSAVNIDGKGASLVSGFIKSLSSDNLFIDDFPEVKLGPVSKRMVKYTEIMDFEILCYFKE